MQVTSQGACGKPWQCWWWCSLLLHCSDFIGDAVKKQSTAWIQLGTEEPWCRVPVEALRDVWGQKPHGMPTFHHLSCSWFVGNQGREFQAAWNWDPTSTQGASSRSANLLCFPSWSSTRRQPSKLMGPAHMLLPLISVQALHPNWAHSNVLEVLEFFLLPGKTKAMKCHQALKFLCFFECELYWF